MGGLDGLSSSKLWRKPAPLKAKWEVPAGEEVSTSVEVEDRASPLQVVVVSSTATASTCHDLKSGFMEKKMQKIVLAPPLFDTPADLKSERNLDSSNVKYDSSVKNTHPDLVSSDQHDLYVAFKWSSLVTTRAVSAFLQASADLTAASNSHNAQENRKSQSRMESVIYKNSLGHVSPFLIPSFVRMKGLRKG